MTNARALLLMGLVEDAGAEDSRAVRSLTSRYLAFVGHAFDAKRGRFRNRAHTAPGEDRPHFASAGGSLDRSLTGDAQ
jgi:hypothetical protein